MWVVGRCLEAFNDLCLLLYIRKQRGDEAPTPANTNVGAVSIFYWKGNRPKSTAAAGVQGAGGEPGDQWLFSVHVHLPTHTTTGMADTFLCCGDFNSSPGVFATLARCALL